MTERGERDIESNVAHEKDIESRARRHIAAGEPHRALPLAIDAELWNLVAETIEGAWPPLVFKHIGILRRAYAVTPQQEFDDYPGARAVRELLFPVVPTLTSHPPAELPEDPETLQALAERDDADNILRAGAACLVALRMRENWTRARNQAIRLSVVLEVANRHAFDKVASRIPGTELQIAIALFLAGDTVLALRHSDRAFRTADLDPIGYVARDAAGKSALMHAVRGDVTTAAMWLKLSDEAPVIESSLNGAIESTRLAARALIAAAKLDRAEAERVQAEMGWGIVEGEELWALRIHSLIRAGLLFGGDTIGLRRLLEETPDLLPYARNPSPYIRGLLLADSTDLAIALGAGNRAATVLSETEWDDSVVAMSQARLNLLSGDSDSALEGAQKALRSQSVSSRVEVEALVLSAVAQERLGRRDDAARSLHLGLVRANACGSLSGFATVPIDELTALAKAVDIDLPPGIEPLFPPGISIVDLSAREAAVLRHLSDGRSVAEISELDFVSANTVKTQIRSLYRKLRVDNRNEAVDVARSLGVL